MDKSKPRIITEKLRPSPDKPTRIKATLIIPGEHEFRATMNLDIGNYESNHWMHHHAAATALAKMCSLDPFQDFFEKGQRYLSVKREAFVYYAKSAD